MSSFYRLVNWSSEMPTFPRSQNGARSKIQVFSAVLHDRILFSNKIHWGSEDKLLQCPWAKEAMREKRAGLGNWVRAKGWKAGSHGALRERSDQTSKHWLRSRPRSLLLNEGHFLDYSSILREKAEKSPWKKKIRLDMEYKKDKETGFEEKL